MPPASINKKGDAPSNVGLAEKLFIEHGDFIRSVIDFNVKNQVLSEDIFQDLFLFFVSKPIPQDVQSVRGFLYRVVSDRVKDAFRKIGRYQGKIHRYAKCRGRIIEDSPEDIVIEAEEMEKMFELIERRLPKTEALAVTLRYRDNCDTVEVAEKMGIKPRSVSRYVSVGLKKVRQVFGVN